MIPLTILEFHIISKHPLDLGANPGSSIRGALYEALRIMYDTGVEVQSRNHFDENPVAWLLRLEDEHTTGGHHVPRPIAVRPPLTPKTAETQFGLAFYGHGCDHIPMVVSAISAMQQIGLGRGRQKFTLKQIYQIDPLNYERALLVDADGQHVAQQAAPPTKQAYLDVASTFISDHLDVEFLTPTRIVQQKKLCKTPVFSPWFQRLLERVRHISELYTDAPIWIPFKDLLTLADSIQIEKDNTSWCETRSGSRRDNKMRPTSGFKGAVTYTGNFSQLLPWVVLGQALQIGKNTVKGNGWYRINQ